MACLVDTFKPCSSSSYDFANIVYNPMFTELQATLATDCIRQSVPYFLVQGQGRTEQPVKHTNTDLLIEDAILQAEFRQLSPLANPKVVELEVFYNTQSASILTQRSDALVAVQQKGLYPNQLRTEILAINAYYDQEQRHLTMRISKSLQLLKCMLPHELAQSGGATKKNKVRQLNAQAVYIMTEWYESHLDNPYPTAIEKEVMAEQGQISVSQVKAWFANKRNRSMNTKPKREKQKLVQQMHLICQQIQMTEYEYSQQSAQSPRLDPAKNYSEILDDLTSLVHSQQADILHGSGSSSYGYDFSVSHLQV